MRRHSARTAAVFVALFALILGSATPPAVAQNTDEIVSELEEFGYYIESGADATESEMRSLVAQADRTDEQWYFVVLSGPADFEYAATLRDRVRPTGNVIVHSVDEDSQGLFDNVDLATGSTEAIELQALEPFDGNWNRPADYLDDVVREYDRLTTSTTSTTSTNTTSGGSSSGSASSSSGGSGFLLWLIGIPVVGGAILWFLNRRSKKKQAESQIEAAQKVRAELQVELDELANDVLVLSGPVDLSDKPEAIQYYREATDTYLAISDEIPDPEELNQANLSTLADIGVRVAHARWQMDAAEAILDGEPIPEKPKVEPPPPPPSAPPTRTIEEQRQRLPQREPRPRVSYSQSRRRSGGGLLDILIAAGGMAASGRRRGGGMFGSSRSRTSTRSSSPRPGGGVFGSSTGSRSSSTRTSSRSGRSTSRSSSRRSGGRRSTSKRRRR